MKNVENTISEPLDFKIFWGMMPLDPTTNSPPPPQVENRLRL